MQFVLPIITFLPVVVIQCKLLTNRYTSMQRERVCGCLPTTL